MADYTYEQAAELLPPRITASWLRTHIDELPHLRFSRNNIYFTDKHIEEIREQFEYRPDQKAAS